MSQSSSTQTVIVDYSSAVLAKRLAEAADCFRDNLYRYFICNSEPPFDLKYTQGYLTATEASIADDELLTPELTAAGYRKFGAYKTSSNDGEHPVNYDTIQLKFTKNDAEVYSENLTSDVDAIILSLSAYDKFFQPYYVRLYGLETANTIRSNVKAALTASTLKPVKHSGALLTAMGTGGTKVIIKDLFAY